LLTDSKVKLLSSSYEDPKVYLDKTLRNSPRQRYNDNIEEDQGLTNSQLVEEGREVQQYASHPKLLNVIDHLEIERRQKELEHKKKYQLGNSYIKQGLQSVKKTVVRLPDQYSGSKTENSQSYDLNSRRSPIQESTSGPAAYDLQQNKPPSEDKYHSLEEVFKARDRKLDGRATVQAPPPRPKRRLGHSSQNSQNNSASSYNNTAHKLSNQSYSTPRKSKLRAKDISIEAADVATPNNTLPPPKPMKRLPTTTNKSLTGHQDAPINELTTSDITRYKAVTPSETQHNQSSNHPTRLHNGRNQLIGSKNSVKLPQIPALIKRLSTELNEDGSRSLSEVTNFDRKKEVENFFSRANPNADTLDHQTLIDLQQANSRFAKVNKPVLPEEVPPKELTMKPEAKRDPLLRRLSRDLSPSHRKTANSPRAKQRQNQELCEYFAKGILS
jgi:hypothetical protein